jgi:hypothetical protein
MRFSVFSSGIATLTVLGCSSAQHSQTGVLRNFAITQIPVRFLADRFAVAPISERGDTLILFTDTGGGTSRV